MLFNPRTWMRNLAVMILRIVPDGHIGTDLKGVVVEEENLWHLRSRIPITFSKKMP